jgi:hypothetical protein
MRGFLILILVAAVIFPLGGNRNRPCSAGVDTSPLCPDPQAKECAHDCRAGTCRNLKAPEGAASNCCPRVPVPDNAKNSPAGGAPILEPIQSGPGVHVRSPGSRLGRFRQPRFVAWSPTALQYDLLCRRQI